MVLLLFLLKIFGFIVSRLPSKTIRMISVAIGSGVFWLMPRRRRIALSNLHHAFPEKTEKERVAICMESFSRMIELGLLAASIGYLPKERIKENFSASQMLIRTISAIKKSGRGAVMLVPHLTLMESLTFIPELVDLELPETGVVYRPFDNKALENFIKKSRERFGIKLLSRKKGFSDAMKILKSGGIVALLFDQNAGCSGRTTTFLGRRAQASNLHGLLAVKYKAPVYFLYPQRKNTWSAEIKIEKLCNECSSAIDVAIAANQWLENKLCSNEDTCSDWLWAHDRWKITNDKGMLFSTSKTRNWLEETKRLLKYKSFPKTFRVFVRMPNWLGDIVMAIPVLRALKRSRPDIELTLLCKAHFIEFFNILKIADNFIEMPKKGKKYFSHFFKYRKLYPDVHIVFTNSLRGDIEAAIIGATVRLGMYRNHTRPFLTEIYKFWPDFDASNIHQTKILSIFLQQYGLTKNINFRPYKMFIEITDECVNNKCSIGLICGSSNNTEKRWPIEHWRVLSERLLGQYPNIQLKLYGTGFDSPMGEKIMLGLGKYRIQQLCGKTTIVELIKNMQSDNLIVSGDTGGMHIANMFDKPIVCLFGPTNAMHTGPIFNSRKIIVRPEGCPEKGGFSMEDITVEQVFSAISAIMDSPINS